MDVTVRRPRPTQLTTRQILRAWWPLAFSWLLMSIEIPAISAVIARLADPEVNLAAFGGVVYPLALIIESPVIMLLGASVALCRHRQAYDLVWRYMMVSGAILTIVHLLIAFTPLYDLVVVRLIGIPGEIVEPARLGLKFMVPWTWAIGFRRFNQGVLIRHGYSSAVGFGTIIRLIVDGTALGLGFIFHPFAGVAVGASAQSLGVISEAVYAGWRIRPVLKQDLPRIIPDDPLTWKAFYHFYVPLVLTSLISFIWQPVGSAALSRMPDALNSLAVWPVVTGLVSLLRSFGVAYNEAVVALLDRFDAWRNLSRFTIWMALATTGVTLMVAATPLADFYFRTLSALPGPLVDMARTALWIAIPMPAMAVLQNWFQGSLLYGRITRGVPESVAIFFVTVLIVLTIGVSINRWSGILVGMTGFVLANVTQMAWLWVRSRTIMANLSRRDQGITPDY